MTQDTFFPFLMLLTLSQLIIGLNFKRRAIECVQG